MDRMSRAFSAELSKEGIRHVFGIPSIHNIGLYDALREEASVRHILCRHESSAVHMADGYARGGERTGICNHFHRTRGRLHDRAAGGSLVEFITGVRPDHEHFLGQDRQKDRCLARNRRPGIDV